MKSKERNEIIEIFNSEIRYLEDHLDEFVFLCQMDIDISIRDINERKKVCGWNNRMIPQAIDYLVSQKPTNRKNKDYYHTPYYDKESNIGDSWWAYNYSAPRTVIEQNMEKIRFLKHLIQKLKL